MNQNEQIREDIEYDIQAAYDYMDMAIEQSRRARHELEHWKNEYEKLSHECARLRLVIARIKKTDCSTKLQPVAYETENEIWHAECPDINDYIRKHGIPLYRHPPAPMVRLTEEEIQAVWEPLHDAICLDHRVFAHAIMDALEAKNGG